MSIPPSEPVAITRAPSPDSYMQAVRDLPVEQIQAEQRRLDVSEARLEDTISQLSTEEYKHEDFARAVLLFPEYHGKDFAREAISENQQVINSYTWRREILQDELARRGHSTYQQSGTGIEL